MAGTLGFLTAGVSAVFKSHFAAMSASPNVTALIECTDVKLREPTDDELVFL